MDNLLSSKFILTVLIEVAAFILLVLGRIEPALWQEVALIGLGVFTAGNVVQKFAPAQELVSSKITTTTEVK
jgi:hypothetical protein